MAWPLITEAAAMLAALGAGGLLKAGVDRYFARKDKREEAPVAIGQSQAELARVYGDNTAALIKELQQERRLLRQQVRASSRSVHRLVKRVEDLETENAECARRGREQHQQLLSLITLLRANGIPIPPDELPGSFIVMEGDRTTVLKPGPPRRRAASTAEGVEHEP